MRGRLGQDCPNWKGGKIIHHGYIYIHAPDHPYSHPNGYVHEHRLVMEKKLGRYLEQYEDIHHINGIKDDNRIENLQLLSHSQHISITNSLIPRNNPRDQKTGRFVKK